VHMKSFNESRAALVPVLILGIALIVIGFFPTIALNLIKPVIQELPHIP
jgi:formate hydrogenlyase subunit 3/multisubunit Na+/H+ antiporter MnhD subunit